MSLLTAFSAAESKKEPPLITGMVTPDSAFVGDRVHCIINIRHSDREVATLEWRDGIDTLSSRSFELISSKHLSTTPFPGSSQESCLLYTSDAADE